jgi:hypothetical protein
MDGIGKEKEKENFVPLLCGHLSFFTGQHFRTLWKNSFVGRGAGGGISFLLRKITTYSFDLTIYLNFEKITIIQKTLRHMDHRFFQHEDLHSSNLR